MSRSTKTQYLVPVTMGTLVAMLGLILIITNLDPYKTGVTGHIAFYAMIFLSTTGLTTLITLLLRQKFFPGIYAELFRISLRQAILIAGLITGLLVLESFNILYWWVGLTLAMFLIAIESFFSAN